MLTWCIWVILKCPTDSFIKKRIERRKRSVLSAQSHIWINWSRGFTVKISRFVSLHWCSIPEWENYSLWCPKKVKMWVHFMCDWWCFNSLLFLLLQLDCRLPEAVKRFFYMKTLFKNALIPADDDHACIHFFSIF